LHSNDDMATEPTLPDESANSKSEPPEVVHQFTVSRGMTVALVIETPDWYLGLLQSAVARVKLEGDN